MGNFKLRLLLLVAAGILMETPSQSNAYGRRRSSGTPSCYRATNPRICLACNAYYEARGESFLGQVAVNQAVLTRVRRQGFPKSVCGVVYQRNQFSWTHEGHGPYKFAAAWASSLRAADKALELGANGFDHFHATYVRPAWARACGIGKRLGLHIFYNCSQRSSYASRRHYKRIRSTHFWRYGAR